MRASLQNVAFSSSAGVLLPHRPVLTVMPLYSREAITKKKEPFVPFSNVNINPFNHRVYFAQEENDSHCQIVNGNNIETTRKKESLCVQGIIVFLTEY